MSLGVLHYVVNVIKSYAHGIENIDPELFDPGHVLVDVQQAWQAAPTTLQYHDTHPHCRAYTMI
jgi:hypothetical protein